MSSQYQSKKSNDTIKFSDIDVSQITVVNEIYGKQEKRSHSLIRYGPEKKELSIQCPWVKMNQYGLLPGQYLKDGKKNEYYTSEEARCFVRFPVDAESSSVSKPDGTTNSAEISAFIAKLKEIDDYVKKSTTIRKAAEISDDDVEKYNCIFRKTKVAKKIPGKEVKPKANYMKPKLFMNYKNKDEVLTQFFEIDSENNRSALQPKEDFVTLSDIENLLVYNCEQQCVIKLVEVWSQAIGTWGITTKVMMMRVKKPTRSVKQNNSDFVDDDEETVVSKPTKSVTKPVVKQADESDGSDDEPVKKQEEKAPVKKQIAEVDTDDSDDEPVKPIKEVKKKLIVSDNSDDEVVPVKKPIKKDVESDDDAVPIKKPARGGKAKK